jgi:hypothetical protein
MVRLRENETSILAGMMQNNEFRNITGPNPFGALGGTLASHNSTQSETELLIAITPRQLRLGPRAGRTLYAGRGEGPEPPAPPPLQPGESNLAAPQTLPGEAGGQPGELPPPPGVQPDALPPDFQAPPPLPPVQQGPG